MKKILHIARDSVFIDMAHRIFEEAAPGRSDFILFSNEKELRFIKSTPVRRYSRYLIYSPCMLRRILGQYRIFIFHALDSENLFILRSLPKDVKVVWLGWGFDYYDLINNEQLKPITKLLQYTVKETFSQRLKSVVLRILCIQPDKIFLINKVDIISVLHKEYLLLKNSISDFKPKHFLWTYGTLEDDLIRGFEGVHINGANILLGNSASITNNHIDALELLRTLEVEGKKIITPLSYGNEDYRNMVTMYGKKLFGDMFVPVVEFMPIDKYINLVSTCSIMIMNNLRQQGVGNIVIMMYLGAKVFLDSENPAYSFFQQLGALIYKLDELASEINSPLSFEQIEINRSVIRNNWGREIVARKTRRLIAILDGQAPGE